MNSPLALRRAPGRRSFLSTLGTGAASALLAQIPGRVLAQSTTTSSGGYLASTDTTSELLFMSAVKHAQLIREKKISSVELVKACLARIEKVNPQLNAVVTLCAERALAEAAEADALLAKGTIKGPLHGVPMTIKDSFDTAGLVSTGGTLGRKDFVPGKDATVVSFARGMVYALEAAERLAKDGIDVEVIDLRTLRPLDMATVLASVKKTNRIVTVEEAWPVCSVGSEICAQVAMQAFDDLDAPPAKVSGADVPMPYAANLEKLALPSVERVIAAVKSVMYV